MPINKQREGLAPFDPRNMVIPKKEKKKKDSQQFCRAINKKHEEALNTNYADGINNQH